MKKLLLTPAMAVALASLLVVEAEARPNVPSSTNLQGGRGTVSTLSKMQFNCVLGASKAELDINNVRAMVLNGGDMWWDLDNPRYEVPKVDDPSGIKKHSLFAGAVWIGGIEETGGAGTLHVSTQTYRQNLGGIQQRGYFPGPINPGMQTNATVCALFDFHAKINRSDIAAFENRVLQGVPVPENEIPQSIKNWPAKGNPFRSNISSMGMGALAPFIDADDDEIYDPRNGDMPRIRGDQAIWWIMNDIGNTKQPLTPAIGLEMQVMAFGFQTGDLVNNMTFYEQTMINRGNKVLKQSYLAQWVDPDLGNYLDDYVGCDVARGLGYCYNGDEFDEGVTGYGANPPAIGVDFFAGPRSDPNDGLDNDRDGLIDNLVPVVNCEDPTAPPVMMTEEIIMSNFVYYNNDGSPLNGNPLEATDFYNYMQSRWRNGNPIYFGGDGTTLLPGVPAQTYKFMFPGDPRGGSANTDPLGYGYHTPQNVPPGTPYTPNPVPNINWTERQAGNVPADRRFLQSAGPFTLSPGQILPLTIGVVWVRASSGGAVGSLNLLAVADDAAQALFNNCFDIPVGPNAPNLAITELDRELIISIIPDEYIFKNQLINTEQFVDLDRTYQGNPLIDDPFYRFQGYVVYQLKHANVRPQDLGNPDLARIVEAENGSGQSDIADGLGMLVNRDFDPDLNAYVSNIMVRGEDKGIRHTLRVKRDMFAQGDASLVNFKTYHYMAIAYASNSFNDNTVFDSFRQYRSGNANVRAYSAIPHKVAPESGMVLNAEAGQQLPVTRIYGVGNGQNILDLAAGEEDSIRMMTIKPTVRYAADGSPVAINIYDPKRVARAKFNLKLSTRISFFLNEATGMSVDQNGNLIGLSPGDIIEAQALPAINPTVQLPTRATNIPQIPGRARINRIVSTNPASDDQQQRRFIVLDVEMLNDELGGTFVQYVDSMRPGSSTQDPPVLLEYIERPLTFTKEGSGGSVTGKVRKGGYGLHDFWRLIINRENGTTETVYSNRTLSDFDEQLLPDYGLSIQLRGALNPGFQVEDNRHNQVRESTIEFASVAWLAPVSTETTGWLIPAPESGQFDDRVSPIDPGGAFTRVLDGSWAPYEVSRNATQGGAAHQLFTAPRRIGDLPNVNVVFTADRTKWTRVPVLQVERFQGCNGPAITANLLRMLKSELPSVDQEGNPTGETSTTTAGVTVPSTGMGWFPGYAIDLDRGIRVNMMFAEDASLPNGNDLLYNPTSDPNGGKHFIYLLDTPYDEGRAMERTFDDVQTDGSLFQTSGPNAGCLLNAEVNNFQARVRPIFNPVTWVGNMRAIPGATLLSSDARVRLRVNRQYNSYSTPGTDPTVNDNPEYAFDTYGQAVSTNNVAVAKSALELIRVVPNPYYAYSDYEQRVTDNIVKITNLPPRATISIFNLNGTLVQTIQKDDPTLTFVNWNLKNRDNLSIASGVYIIHVKARLRDAAGAETEEEKVIKFFAILRPIDLQSF